MDISEFDSGRADRVSVERPSARGGSRARRPENAHSAEGTAPPSASRRRVPAWLVAVPVLVFPGLVATAEGAGSYVFTFLLLAAAVWGRGWRDLGDHERRLLLGFGVAALVMAISLVNTEELREGLKWLERYVRIAMIVPIYLMLRRFRLDLAWALGAGAVVATLVMAGQAWYQVVWRDGEMAVGAYHKIIFGDLAVLWGAVAVAFALTLIRGRMALPVACVAVAASLYAAALSQSRGAWLFIPVAGLALAWVHRRQLRAGRTARRAAGALLLVLAGVGVLQFEYFASGVRLAAGEFTAATWQPDANASWTVRLNLWRNAVLVAVERPILGTGLGDFQREMRAMVRDGRSWNSAVAYYTHAHSIYFDALASAGVAGLVAMIAAYLVLPFRAFVRGLRVVKTRRGRFHAVTGILTILGFATFGLSEALWARNAFVNTYVVCIVVLLAGLSRDARRRGRRDWAPAREGSVP